MKQVRSMSGVFLSSILALWLASPAFAQQRSGRVFTNEDFPAAPAPAVAAPPAQPASPAASAEAAPETPAADVDPLKPSANPKELVERLTAAQATLRFVMDQFNQKEAAETDEAAKERWHSMAQSIIMALQGNQQLLTEAQQEMQKPESAPAPPAQ